MTATTLLTFSWGLLAAVLLMLATLFMHYEGLRWLGGHVSNASARRHRWYMLMIMLGIFALHTAEILLYALALAAMVALELGSLVFIENLPGGTWGTHYAYYAAVIYTSVGFGDLVPTGALRIVSGLAALNGLLLIAWSASFTYLMMHKLWGNSD